MNVWNMIQQIGNISFFSNFDSGNLAAVKEVELSRKSEDATKPFDKEFHLWTAPDAAGTSNENKNRTWFYFGIQGSLMNLKVRFTIMNMNKQCKLYLNGMSPVFKVVSSTSTGKWTRVKDRAVYEFVDGQFQLSFGHTFSNISSKITTTYFAFTYPYSYETCQQQLHDLEMKYCNDETLASGIYFHRDLLTRSIDGLNIDLLTITSSKNMNEENEDNIADLYPEYSKTRAKSFSNKKIFLLTSRVHPGETPSSFVFNGFLNFILQPDNEQASVLRDVFVFKLIPMLNPDGVKRGHYRTDSNGVNLNRVYIKPDIINHPSVYAVRKLIEYYSIDGNNNSSLHGNIQSNINCHDSNETLSDVSSGELLPNGIPTELSCTTDLIKSKSVSRESNDKPLVKSSLESVILSDKISNKNRIEIYVDLHAHASKMGCFMYGNHFESEEENILCMLFPKLVSLATPLFDFSACNFSEKNMYQKDKKDGSSKAGSGRVAMARAFHILHSYTLECNYNCGRFGMTPFWKSVGKPPNSRNSSTLTTKFTPEHFEKVGVAVAVATLDMFSRNSCSQLHDTEYKSLAGVKTWLKKHIKDLAERKTLSPTLKKSVKKGKRNEKIKKTPPIDSTCSIANGMEKLDVKSSASTERSSIIRSCRTKNRRSIPMSVVTPAARNMNITYPPLRYDRRKSTKTISDELSATKNEIPSRLSVIS